MSRSLVAPLILIVIGTSLPAQPDQNESRNTTTQETQRSLEALRKRAREAVQQMEAVFERELADAIRILRKVRPERDTQEAFEARARLADWASVFPDRFANLIKEAGESKGLQAHLCEVMALSASPEAADALAGLFGVSPDLDLNLVRAISFIPEAGPAPRAKLLALAKTPPSTEVLGAVIVALARLQEESAAPLARQTLASPNAAPQLVADAVKALALTLADPRGDVAILRKLAQKKDLDKTVHMAVLRAFGKYERSTQTRRLVHEALDSEDRDIIEAALDGLETIASKESSRKPLLDVVKNTAIDRPLRERAARMLMGLGIRDGIRALVAGLKRAADSEPRNASRQRDLAVEYKRLGGYDDAITYFERAARQSNAARRYEYRVWIARCRSLMGQFDKAGSELKKAGYESFSSFAEDADFAEMKKDPKWAPFFEKKSG